MNGKKGCKIKSFSECDATLNMANKRALYFPALPPAIAPRRAGIGARTRAS